MPLEYYQNNLDSTFALVRAMQRHGCFRLVFSSSATVYGDNAPVPMKEEYPTSATNPYGWTKVMIEQVLRDVARTDERWRIALLRYFNPVGAHASGTIGEDPQGIPNNLMPFIAQVAVGKLEKLLVFGDDYDTPDGTCLRDYIHVEDLAAGHLAALVKLGSTDERVSTWNLGTGHGTSVLEVLHAFEKACGHELPHEVVGRRAGDIAASYADPSRAEASWAGRRPARSRTCAPTSGAGSAATPWATRTERLAGGLHQPVEQCLLVRHRRRVDLRMPLHRNDVRLSGLEGLYAPVGRGRAEHHPLGDAVTGLVVVRPAEPGRRAPITCSTSVPGTMSTSCGLLPCGTVVSS